ncbi:MAG: hypothetical protein GY823_11810 [Flavobacteriaceae bacterium]|nr:hypothetical protein [Flavobacteriaceae bacterium]
MALLQMTLPDRGEESLQDKYWFSISNEFVTKTDKDGKLISWGTDGFFYERIFLDKKIIEKKDNTLIYYEFKRLFNNRLLNFSEFGYELRNMLTVSLIEGKIVFEMKDDLKSLGYIIKDDLTYTSSLLIKFSRPLAHFLGLEDEISGTLEEFNGGYIKYPNYKRKDGIKNLQYIDLIIYKKRANGHSLTGGKINCLSRIKDGVHINPHAAINIKCDLLESNFLGGIVKQRVLRKVSFYDVELDTYVRYFAPKNIIFTPVEKLQFQQISIRLEDDEGNPVKLTSFYSPKQYIGETSITVRIRPVI